MKLCDCCGAGDPWKRRREHPERCSLVNISRRRNLLKDSRLAIMNRLQRFFRSALNATISVIVTAPFGNNFAVLHLRGRCRQPKLPRPRRCRPALEPTRRATPTEHQTRSLRAFKLSFLRKVTTACLRKVTAACLSFCIPVPSGSRPARTQPSAALRGGPQSTIAPFDVCPATRESADNGLLVVVGSNRTCAGDGAKCPNRKAGRLC